MANVPVGTVYISIIAVFGNEAFRGHSLTESEKMPGNTHTLYTYTHIRVCVCV